ncbi:MAG: serine/threonine-protein kinase [Myxococcota bacterium]
MTLWDRLRGLLGPEEASPESPAPEAREAARKSAPRPAEGPEARLAALADAAERPDGSLATQLLEELVREGRAKRGLELARRVLERHVGDDGRLVELGVRVAELLSGRGDDASASRELARFVGTADAPLSALMLAAEIAERRGEGEEALALYEKVLARDLDFPRARERALRLRGARASRPGLAGATIATEGALTRGRYRVERELGRGGAGTVFLALDQALGRRVALKVYHRRGRVERERLRAEARTPAQLEHPGVVRVFDIDERLVAVAMEAVAGGSVRRELTKGGVSVARARRWLVTAAEALDFIHAGGVVHRDVKPSNFLLREDDRVVLTDFGLATPLGDVPLAGANGLGEGTLQYMPPEQKMNAIAEPSADVYAFGASMRDVLGALGEPAPESWAELATACLADAPKERPGLDALRVGLRAEAP